MTVARIFTKIYIFLDNGFCHFTTSNVRFAFWGIFENRKNSGLTPGQNDDPVTQ